MQDGAVASAVAVDGGLELLDEAAAVGQAGQRVVVCLGGQLLQAQLLDRAQRGVLDDERALERHLAHGLADRRGPGAGLLTDPVTTSPSSRSPASSGTLT